MSSYNNKVKSILEKVYDSVENAESFSSKSFNEDYVSSLIEAQKRGEIANLKFKASEDGVIASFSFNQKSKANLLIG